jgi:hypothetical protein
MATMVGRGAPHHIELWVESLDEARGSLGWLLGELGYERASAWPAGESWRLGNFYVVFESGPDLIPGRHERRRAGMNHVAFWAGTRDDVDRLAKAAAEHGWSLMFADLHPYAGGQHHYAAYLESSSGFEVELVAEDPDHFT